MSQRNCTAHESHVQFALLLWNDFKDDEIFLLWAPLFPFVYGHSVEEIVVSYCDDEALSGVADRLLI